MSEKRSLHIATEEETFRRLKRSSFEKVFGKFVAQSISGKKADSELLNKYGWTLEEFLDESKRRGYIQ